MGILAALAIPRLTATRANAEMKTAVADSRTIASAVALFVADGGAITSTTAPTVSDLSAYLTDASGLASKYTITYTAAGGEIARITRNPAITIDGAALSIWEPGSDVLVAPTP